MALHPHLPADVQHFIPMQKLVHEDGVHVALPLDDADPDDEELALLPHIPLMHVCMVTVQSAHTPPVVPHAVSVVPG
jgi:hypothetical protein